MSTVSDFITQARARLDKATKGPLEVVRFDSEGGYISYQVETMISKSQHAILGSYSDLDNPKAKADAILAANAPVDLATALSAEVAWEALGWYAGFEISHKWEGIVSPNTPFSKYIEGKSQPISPAQQAQAEINRLLNEDKK